MMKTAEMKIEVSDCIFKKVLASELRLTDDFMKYQPKTEREHDFKNMVKTAINSGLQDFYRPTLDPSFFDFNWRIGYHYGMKPAVGENYKMWEKIAKEFMPERGSRLGTKSEYIAFLAVLIKEMVASGKTLEWAWNAVCNDSKELGHYWNSSNWVLTSWNPSNSMHAFEPTGYREICGWYDLANTFKILADDKEDFGHWLAGGCYCVKSNQSPLAVLSHCIYRWVVYCNSTGWLVLTEGSTDH